MLLMYDTKNHIVLKKWSIEISIEKTDMWPLLHKWNQLRIVVGLLELTQYLVIRINHY